MQKENLDKHLSDKLYELFGRDLYAALESSADALGQELRVVGGTVRDLILDRPTSDFDFVTEGSGLLLAEQLKEKLGKRARVTLFRNFGTAQVKYRGLELEFVGARRESYRADSRKPVVEEGSFADDEKRRDFTINALSITLNGSGKGTLHDPFGGLEDLERGLIRTPLDPDVTFSDDPLRMMRAVRFAAQLGFSVPEEIKEAIRRNSDRLKIVSMERVTTEFLKIMDSRKPSVGLGLMQETGLMPLYLPEISALMGAETRDGIGHKNNFYHTITVVDQLSDRSDKEELRLAALFHDVGKPIVKKFTPGAGWSFYNHDFVGMKMLPKIFRRVKLPLDERLKYVQKLVRLHMRPAQLADEGVTDSAVRRLLFEAGDDIDDLMTLCESDLTSKNPDKVRKYLDNFALVREKLKEIEEKDRIRNFQPPVKGEEIMATYGLEPRREVGLIKEAIKDAILDGIIPNDHEAAYDFMVDFARKNYGLEPLV
ncbi:MAG: HD domain-containing protein [Porphyromonas sp.]|nr:HD domain-containing protein [Bacteroidales bacterium]MDY3099963.1 HD domain-containing protein [Porphyromonas sp.]